MRKIYGKPYFSTYVKSSMFIIYLAGFIVWRSWWLQCHKSSMVKVSSGWGRAEIVRSQWLDYQCILILKYTTPLADG